MRSKQNEFVYKKNQQARARFKKSRHIQKERESLTTSPTIAIRAELRAEAVAMEARVAMCLDKGLGDEPEGEHTVGACTNVLSITTLESSLAISPACTNVNLIVEFVRSGRSRGNGNVF